LLSRQPCRHFDLHRGEPQIPLELPPAVGNNPAYFCEAHPVPARLIGVLFLLSLLTGCASVTGSNVQTLKIEAKMADGTMVEGADCELVNELGKFRVTTPGYVNVRRSFSKLKINCVKGDLPAANGTGKPMPNVGMFGNILIGGMVGVTVDHVRGAGYSYPEWMQLVFGKYLLFSRLDDHDEQPSMGIEQIIYR
jgi:hypothetical protein